MNVAIIPSNPPADNRWTQRVCATTKPTKKLVLHDHSNGLYLPGNQYDSLKVADVEFKEHVAVSTDDATLVHAVAHVESRDAFTRGVFESANNFQTEDSRQLIVLQVSRTESVADVSHASDKVVWLAMKSRAAYMEVQLWLPEFLKLDFITAGTLAGVAAAGDRSKATQCENDYAHLLDIILPGRVENLLAFRLLCEATKVVAAENTKRTTNAEQESNTAELSGITIHAPKHIGEWLSPFGENSSETDIPKVAGMIGSGYVKTAAENVLKAVVQNQDPSEAITNFLKADRPQNS